MPATYDLPVVPRHMKRGYWNLSGSTPDVRDRWVLTAFRDQQRPTGVFWMGDCLYCGHATWMYQDGTIDDHFSHYALVPIRDPETGVIYRACMRCAGDEYRAAQVIAVGHSRLGEDGDGDVSPIKWHTPQQRVAAIDSGKNRLRVKAVRHG